MPVRDYRATTEAIAASTTVSFSKGLPKDPVSRFGFLNTGVNNGLNGTGAPVYRAKLGSAILWDAAGSHVRSLLEALLSPLGGALPATTGLRYTIPFDLYNESLEIGLPSGDHTFETTYGASGSAGAQRISWLIPDREPKLVPQFVQEAMGVGTSQTNGRYDIETGEGNLVLGFSLPMISATGITRIRLRRKRKDGLGFDDIFTGEQDEIYESQAHYNAEAIATPFFWKPPILADYPDGSYMEVTNGAASATGDTIAALVLLPAAAVKLIAGNKS